MRLLCCCYAVAIFLLCGCYAAPAVAMRLLCGCYAAPAVAVLLLCGFYAVAMRLLCGYCAVATRLLCGCYAVACFITFSILVSFFPLFFAKFKIFLKKIKSSKNFLLARAIHREHFLLQCLKKEIATAKELLDLRPLGKVIIFRDKQNLPIIYRLLL